MKTKHPVYEKLVTSREFLGHGLRKLPHIYVMTQQQFPNLCRRYPRCSCGGKLRQQPEWQHAVRSALNELRKRGFVAKGEREEWVL